MPISTPTMVHPRNKRKTIWYVVTALIIAGCIYTLPSKRSQISSSLTFGSGQLAGRPTELGDEPTPDLEEQEQDVLAAGDDGRGRLCSDEQWNRGNWVKREKVLKTLEDVRDAWGFDPRANLVCHPVDVGDGTPATDPRHMSRILDVAGWEYELPDGCGRIPFSTKDFMVRSLRSKAGFTIVGDSIQEQIYAALQAFYEDENSLFTVQSVYPENTHLLWLNKDNPRAEEIIAEAGVESWRLSIPLVTFHRDNAVLTRREIDQSFSGMDVLMSLEDHPEFETSSITINTTWYRDWKKLLQEEKSPISDEGKARGIVEEENVGLVSYGPHWNHGEMAAERLSFDELAEAYRKSVDILARRLMTLVPYDLKLYIRTTSPGHVDCDIYSKPENDRTTQRSTQDPEKQMFNWDLFEPMNSFWQKKLAETDKMEYLDIWSMSIKRPDAHKNPPFDCLHFCLPGPQVTWVELIWHKLAQRSRNTDYAVFKDSILP